MRGTGGARDSAVMTSATAPATPATDRWSATRRACAAALVLLALGQLVGYLVLTAVPNPGIASTAVLPLAAAAAVLRLPGLTGPAAALAVVATVVATRTVELPFDLARPDATGPFAFALAQLAACGVAAGTAARLLLPADRGSAVVLPAAAGVVAAAVVGAGLLTLAPQRDLTGGLSDEELAALPEVSMVDYRFEPAQLRVAAGQPFAITFTNDGARPHSFAVDSLGVDVAVPSGRSRTVVLALAPGSYDYVCSVGDHEVEGMKGRVLVVDEAGAVPAGLPAESPADHRGHGAHAHGAGGG